ncbi:protein of unknown function DUF1674 [Gluconacetobacter diazotrophicus PA1 5]|uniref:Uncharacterized protein n=2 Tax=Gluconacetobacter diazotrophicus TaxID=33996 RepID=A9H423_GLUDA|nr:DUF1674 domain-containing protein [Gluconacetobacter diazotrophicus]ACI52658.1 protein of unknown function DUF1674 [Gluconacetobacter diazotrophicus PA1 5]MBB2156411.1 DUF1674 domain-containing protein [Gluconacetobacter diazotrophicus]TWB06065.1 uncharacterized protein DUF1674 [Gluconacetobacter diazotrophicus]CAP57389.1 hypothetical protein GDI3446 [Gluconacetobacter diazotrophicus PA1 5]
MTDTQTPKPEPSVTQPQGNAEKPAEPHEYGGPKEQRPTRYGDWTVKGRCIDF